MKAKPPKLPKPVKAWAICGPDGLLFDACAEKRPVEDLMESIDENCEVEWRHGKYGRRPLEIIPVLITPIRPRRRKAKRK